MMEQSIRAVNREIMHPIVDPLTEDKVLSVSIEVAKRRAKYIDLTLQLGDASENQPSAEELNKARDNYILPLEMHSPNSCGQLNKVTSICRQKLKKRISFGA